MGRKKNPYLALYTRDILSSPRCRALSASAAGIYFFLLCRLNEPPMPGAYRLSDWEAHPKWRRSKTQQCLATADKYERLQYFATLLAKNDLPWRQKDILAGLQELYRYGIVTIEDDMLVQPRMYKDNGYTLPELDDDSYTVNTILDDPASGSMACMDEDGKVKNKGANKCAVLGTQKGTEKVQRKAPVSRAHATRNEVEYEIERENNIDNNSSKGGMGENARNDDDPLFNEFWTMYDKRPTFKGGRQYCVRQWYALTPGERQEALDFLPQYVAATPVRQYRMSPATYLTHKAWRKVVIRDGAVIQGINSKGEPMPVMVKTLENAPVGTEMPQISQNKNGVGHLPNGEEKCAQKPRNASEGDAKFPVAAAPPTLNEIQDYMQQRGEAGDPFRHITAEEFYDDGCQNGWTIRGGQPLYDWRARLRSLEGYRRKNGEPTVTKEGYVSYCDGKLVGTLAVNTHTNNKGYTQGYERTTINQRGTAGGQGDHQKGDDGMLQQSVRIIQRIRASREADTTDGADSGSDTR